MFENKLFVYTIYDENSLNNFVKRVIKNFRTSISYDNWLKTIDRTQCKVSGLSRDCVEIEVHHINETLWDIILYCIYKFLDNNITDFNDFYICMLLSELHLNGCVSYIPLSHDYHKMYHDNILEFENMFPNYKENIVLGNMELKDIIINKYIDFYKEQIDNK